VARGTPLHGAVSLPQAAGLHAVRVRVVLPDGAEADWAAETVLAGREPAEFVIPVAFNDPPGTWTLTATDLFTSETRQTAAVQVE
jgi:hypothetical protein